MNHSQPTRRPQGARQRTQDRDRQASLPHSSQATLYSTSEDGVLLSDYSSQGTNLSRSTNNGGTRQKRSHGSASTTDNSNGVPLFPSASNPRLVETPRSINSRSATSQSEHNPLLSPTNDSSHGVRYVSSPVPSISSLRRGSDNEIYFPPSSRRGTGHERQPDNLLFSSDSHPAVPTFIPPPRQSSVPPERSYSTQSQAEPPRPPPDRRATKSPSTDIKNDGEISESSDTSQSQRRWATIRRAVRPTHESPVPPVPRLPADSRHAEFRVQSPAGSTSGVSTNGAAGNIYSPSGSAVSSISNLGLAPPPSTVSSASSTIHASRSARAVMRIQNVVEQARANVGAGISGIGGSGLGGRANFSGNTGGQTRGQFMTRITPLLQELDTPFARDVLQACWAAKLGTEVRSSDSRFGLQPGLNTLNSTAAIGMWRPVKAATGDESVGHSITPSSSSNQMLWGSHSTDNRGSLKQLHHLIASHASGPTRRTTNLPYHTIVLSVLLSPFLLSGPTSTRADDNTRREDEEKRLLEEEQWLAIEIFELLCNGWANITEPQEEVDRWLWCCRAAAQDSLSSKVRARVLATLNGLISKPRPLVHSSQSTGNSSPQPVPSPLAYPKTLQVVLHSLFLIYPRVYGTGMETSMHALHNIVAKIEYGDIPGSDIQLEDLEAEYGASASPGEDVQEVRSILFTEASTRMLETGSEPLRRWFLLQFIESRWPEGIRRRKTPLVQQALFRRLVTFLRLVLDIIREALRSPESVTSRRNTATIISILQSRAIPELEWLKDDLSREPQTLVICAILELSNIIHDETGCRLLLSEWLQERSGWRQAVEDEIKRIIHHDQITVVKRLLETLRMRWPINSDDIMTSIVIPSLFQVCSPVHINSLLICVFSTLAKSYPRVFFLPLITCAKSSNRTTVANQLRTLTAISRVYPEFWTSDSDMMCIALLSDGGIVSGGKGKQRPGEPPKWGKARLGQCVLFMELISFLKQLMKSKKDISSAPSSSMGSTVKFFLELEMRIGVLLNAKETTTLCPFSIRLLVAKLLTEIRLFTHSLKAASWLPKMVEWGCTSHVGALIYGPLDPFENPTSIRKGVPVTEEVVAEAQECLESMRGVYSVWLESMLMTPKEVQSFSHIQTSRKSGLVVKSTEMEHHLAELADLPSASTAILRLLVTISGILSPDDYERLGPVIWSHFLGSAEALSPASFLLMQSAEKGPASAVVRAINDDLTGNSPFLKRRAIDRITRLFSWRYQVLAQTVITDRSHRRPFRSGRPPLSFVATDIGTQNYVADRVQEAERLQFASTLPPEIRRRLIELGWDREPMPDDKKPVKDTVPLSLFSSDRLVAAETTTSILSASENTTKGLLRRKSSSGYQNGGKRRPIFVASLATSLQNILSSALSIDPENTISARTFLLEVLRDDAGLFTRPIFEQLSALNNVPSAISALERTMRLQALLPSPFTHLIFNHLAGLIKTLAREQTTQVDPRVYAYSLPSIAIAASHVSGMSIRELRKAKLDVMLLPSGSLWFSDQSSAGTIFPRLELSKMDESQLLPETLVRITMIRTAQNILLSNLLKRDPKEVHLVRKTFTKFILPSLDDLYSIDNPRLNDSTNNNRTLPNSIVTIRRDFQLISLALGRSHLLLVAQIFRCLNRQTNDYQEILHLLDGVNTILLRHLNDLGIVAHAMINYMLAMTRFRRMFSSNGGFLHIMPAIWRAYLDAQSGNKAIKGAIEYAINRFYALHTEVFIFQSIDIAAALISQSDRESRPKFAATVTQLFSSLGISFRGEFNAGGLQNVTRLYEREVILTTLNDSPELLMNSLESGDTISSVVQQFDSKPFPLENLAKLFLTVIADDPHILRAERFLVLFRYTVPSIYNISMTARTFVRDGIDALSQTIFSKHGGTRGESQPGASSHIEPAIPVSRTVDNQFGKANSPSNFQSMKQEFLHLMVSFTKAGGQLPAACIRRALDLLKVVLRESPGSPVEGAALFLQELTESALLREAKPPPKQAVALMGDIPPLIYSHGYAIDFSGVFNVLIQLCGDEKYLSDPSFAKLVTEGFCGAAMDALESAAMANTLKGVLFRDSFVSLIVACVNGVDVDPLVSLRGRTPSAGILASFVLPLCFQMPSTTSLRNGANPIRRTWIQLLGYALKACQGEHDANSSNATATSVPMERQGSLRGLEASPRAMAATLILALQVVKVIMVRAGEDIALALPDTWLRTASILREVLSEGNGSFSLGNGMSPNPSPSPSRPGSPGRQLEFPNSHSIDTNEREQPPRAVDYGMWSLFEMMCFYRSPLTTQLRLWLQEKLLQIEARLQAAGRNSRRGSIAREGRRLSFSPFTKARRRSGIPSASPSPDVSPSFGVTRTFEPPSRLFLGSPNTLATFDRFPQSSPPAAPNAPRIRHLGPEFQPKDEKRRKGPVNPLRAAAKLVSISQTNLIRDSHKRVTAVRVFWGYESFAGDDMSAFEAWTSADALKRIWQESQKLIEEFHDIVKLNDRGGQRLRNI
ncbi:hypothetical protein CPB86DRAFT_717696 [Serendipita vermifera]|nr:hypothetical protein CPB86DRAFT_717696 [Serendipita vermifera]